MVGGAGRQDACKQRWFIRKLRRTSSRHSPGITWIFTDPKAGPNDQGRPEPGTFCFLPWIVQIVCEPSTWFFKYFNFAHRLVKSRTIVQDYDHATKLTCKGCAVLHLNWPTKILLGNISPVVQTLLLYLCNMQYNIFHFICSRRQDDTAQTWHGWQLAGFFVKYVSFKIAH